MLLTKIESAKSAEQSNFNKQLASLQQRFTRQKARRYAVSPEAIAQYRLDTQRAFAINHDVDRQHSGKEFVQVCERRKQGRLSLDGFPMESDSMLRLVRLEEGEQANQLPALSPSSSASHASSRRIGLLPSLEIHKQSDKQLTAV